jgi:hypothetical protein
MASLRFGTSSAPRFALFGPWSRTAFLALLALSACSKKSDDTDFDRRWSEAEKSVDPVLIESLRVGQGLVGEVRRAVDQPPGTEVKKVDGVLPDGEITRVIRANLAAVKACYDAEEKIGAVGSGKAIVTVDIAPSGAVANVRVDAPAFNDSKVPSCISTRAKGWAFPGFTAKETRRFSYPFVFVGG